MSLGGAGSAVTLLRWQCELGEHAVGTGQVRIVDGVQEPVIQEQPTVTALVGDLRDHLRRWRLDEELLGSLARGASPVAVHAALAQPPTADADTPAVLRAQRTVVDRDSGAAHHLLLRTTTTATSASVALLATTWVDLGEDHLRALASWSPLRVGAGTGTGNGRGRLVGLQVLRLDLGDPDDWDRWVESSLQELFDSADGWRDVAVAPTDRQEPLPGLPEEGVVLVTVDGLQLYPEVPAGDDRGAGRRNHQGSRWRPGGPRLDGESLKGALRSWTERLLRTASLPACRGDEPADTCGTCLACHLFGSAAEAARLLVLPAPVLDLQKRVYAHNSTDHVVGHVRHLWTEERWFGRLRLRLEQDRDRPVSDDGLGVLAQVLADLHDGFLGLGHGATGHGSVRIVDATTLTWARQTARVPAVEAAPR